jgi:hypothetical protein
MAPSRVGRFEIRGELGRGGMGVVYRAWDPTVGREVALKVVSPELAADEQFVARFEQEMRIAARIEHPNVVPVYETGRDDAALYIAMRLVDGPDLREVIRREGGLTVARTATVARQIGGALDAAHAAGLVHRDVKPGNVLFAATHGDEHVYLSDFGLAREAASESGLTNTGNWIGTLDYAAPEQLDGDVVSARTDVYALGCLLFHALVGRVPYEGGVQRKIVGHSVGALPSVGAIPNGALIDAVLARATAKRPEDRFASAGDLGRAFAAAVEGRELDDAEERTVATGAALSGLRTQTLDVADGPTRVHTADGTSTADGTLVAPARAAAASDTDVTRVRPDGERDGATAGAARADRAWAWPVAIVVAVIVLAAGAAVAFGVLGDDDGGGTTAAAEKSAAAAARGTDEATADGDRAAGAKAAGDERATADDRTSDAKAASDGPSGARTRTSSGGASKSARTGEPSAPIGANRGGSGSSSASTITRYDLHDGGGFQAMLPTGAGWGSPSESRPTDSELYRTNLRGPGGLFVVIDHTPYEPATFGGEYVSRTDVDHPVFGTAVRYEFQGGSIPECRQSRCVDYILNDGASGFAVLAGGGVKASAIAEAVAMSLVPVG